MRRDCDDQSGLDRASARRALTALFLKLNFAFMILAYYKFELALTLD